MPYDKGDFTQQGIDGKVSGGLLLNNKRDVDVLVSTNEDNSTLGGVAVTIEDHLNDLKYAFFGENLEAGEVYEIDAGGGGVDNPNLSLVVDTTDYTSDPGTLNFLSLKDGSVWEEWASIQGESTSTFEILVPKAGEEGDIYYQWLGARELTFAINTAYAVSDTVNCTYELDMDNHNFIFSITDGSQPASAKITVTSTE